MLRVPQYLCNNAYYLLPNIAYWLDNYLHIHITGILQLLAFSDLYLLQWSKIGYFQMATPSKSDKGPDYSFEDDNTLPKCQWYKLVISIPSHLPALSLFGGFFVILCYKIISIMISVMLYCGFS